MLFTKRELDEEGSRPVWPDFSVVAVGREELIIVSIKRAMRNADSRLDGIIEERRWERGRARAAGDKRKGYKKIESRTRLSLRLDTKLLAQRALPN